MNQEEYNIYLKERQKRHLENVQMNKSPLNLQFTKPWQPCLHDSCPLCVGTGIKVTGEICVHHISCSCPKCAPFV